MDVVSFVDIFDVTIAVGVNPSDGYIAFPHHLVFCTSNIFDGN